MIEKEKLNDLVYRKQVFDTLREFFGEPCLPVSKYCKSLETWARLRGEKDPEFVKTCREIIVDIHKSCLLDRLIYVGEEVRTEKCPKHKGEWNGKSFNGDCECAAVCGCVTGWLPNK